jgi:hypothetical protein
MKLSEFSVAISVVVGMTAAGSAQAPRGKDLEKPLVIASIDKHVEARRARSGR